MAGASFYRDSYLYNHSRHGNDTENDTLIQPVNGTGIPVAQWTVLPLFSLLVFLAAFFGNGLLLLVFIKERQLRTSFNIYIINLLFANFVLVLIQYPMDIVTNLYNAWLLGHRACQLYLYANSVVGACICNCHMLIAINRMWAVSFPISYRSMHSTRTAVALCVVVWLYVHVGVGPPVIIDALYFHLPEETFGCMVNAPEQTTWEIVIEVIYWLPQIVMLSAFPVTWWAKRKQKRKMHGGGQGNAVGPATANGVATVTQAASSNKPTAIRPATAEDGDSTDNSITKHDHSTIAVAQSSIATVTLTGPLQLPMVKKSKQKHDGSHGFFVLALLTISVMICWTPNNVYYTISFIYVIDNPIFYDLQTILFILQTAIDPIIFTLALKNVRDGLYRLVTFR